MVESKVSGRYAKSLLGLAVEKNSAAKINADMELISKTCQSSKDLSLLLKNPIINSDKKESIIQSLFGNKIDAVTLSFIRIIIRKRRESYLEGIAAEFTRLFKQLSGVETAYVTSASSLNDQLRKDVLELVKKTSPGKQIELKEKTDTSLIGGFVLRVNDKQYDASISSKLRELKKEMKLNLYMKNY